MFLAVALLNEANVTEWGGINSRNGCWWEDILRFDASSLPFAFLWVFAPVRSTPFAIRIFAIAIFLANKCFMFSVHRPLGWSPNGTYISFFWPQLRKATGFAANWYKLVAHIGSMSSVDVTKWMVNSKRMDGLLRCPGYLYMPNESLLGSRVARSGVSVFYTADI